MDEQQFKKGDVVQVKSGGPKMTVCGISEDGNLVECEWIDKKEQRQIGEFSATSLEIYKPRRARVIR